MAFVALATIHQASAGALVADPDYWKQTAERRDAVHRFFYRQSPQTIPPSYDPVREAEEILRWGPFERDSQRSVP